MGEKRLKIGVQEGWQTFLADCIRLTKQPKKYILKGYESDKKPL